MRSQALHRPLLPARRVIGVLLLTLAAACTVLGSTSPAAAHNYLLSSTPAADSTITELPERFEITTNDALLDVGADAGAFALQVVDSSGLYYGDGCVSVSGSSMTAAPALGAAGAYTVRWQVVSADGHTVSDEFSFTWAPTAGFEPSVGSPTPPVCGAVVPSATASPSTEPSASASPANPDPSASASASGAATASASPEPVSSDDSLPTVLWIGGAVIAIAAAVVVTLLITGRRTAR